MFCLLSVFLCCFCLHITEYEQIMEAQNFVGPRGVKYLNTGLHTVHGTLLLSSMNSADVSLTLCTLLLSDTPSTDTELGDSYQLL